MEDSLKGKVAVVTGASHGSRCAVAENLAAAGAHVGLIARRSAPLQQVADNISASDGLASVFPIDVSDPAQVSTTAAGIQSTFGRADILVNNAGIPAPRRLAETDFADCDVVIGTNLSGVFCQTRALWDTLVNADAAYVVTISGTAGLRGGGSPTYGGAKFGLTDLNHAIAQCRQRSQNSCDYSLSGRYRHRLARRTHRR